MLVNFNEILHQAQKRKCAIPHFNINNLEWAKFILEKCEELKVPVILGVSVSAAQYMGGWDVCYNMVTALLQDLNITIPVCLHVDHGTKDECLKAIDSGFNSVMIDASSYDIKENISITSEVVKYAHSKNVSVEAEIGAIGNSNNQDIKYAKLEDCITFCNKVKIDVLAPAIGNCHGIYKSAPNLNFELLSNLSNNINIPLCLHGASGITNDDLQKLIKLGVCKININTDLQIAWKQGVDNYLRDNPDVYDPRKIIGSGKDNMQKRIKELVELFETKRVTEL